MVSEYHGDDVKVEMKIFIPSINGKAVMLETTSDVFVDDTIKLLLLLVI